MLALLYVNLCSNADVIVCKDVCQYNASILKRCITYNDNIILWKITYIIVCADMC